MSSATQVDTNLSIRARVNAPRQISEPFGSTTLVVTRNDTISNVNVDLISSDTTESRRVSLDHYAGQRPGDPEVSLFALNDFLADGTQTVTFTAVTRGGRVYAPIADVVDVLDDERGSFS